MYPERQQKTITAGDLCIAYFVRLVVTLVLFFALNNGKSSYDGLIHSIITTSANLNGPAVIAFIANLLCVKAGKRNGIRGITAFTVDFAVAGVVLLIFGFHQVYNDLMATPEGGTVFGLAILIVPPIFMLTALPFSLFLLILLFVIRKLRSAEQFG